MLVIPDHTDEKNEAMLVQVFWKNDEIEDHTDCQLVPNQPQNVSRIPVMMLRAD